MSDDQVTRIYVEAALDAIDYGHFDGFLPIFEQAISRRKRKAREAVSKRADIPDAGGDVR